MTLFITLLLLRRGRREEGATLFGCGKKNTLHRFKLQHIRRRRGRHWIYLSHGVPHTHVRACMFDHLICEVVVLGLAASEWVGGHVFLGV